VSTDQRSVSPWSTTTCNLEELQPHGPSHSSVHQLRHSLLIELLGIDHVSQRRVRQELDANRLPPRPYSITIAYRPRSPDIPPPPREVNSPPSGLAATRGGDSYCPPDHDQFQSNRKGERLDSWMPRNEIEQEWKRMRTAQDKVGNNNRDGRFALQWIVTPGKAGVVEQL